MNSTLIWLHASLLGSATISLGDPICPGLLQILGLHNMLQVCPDVPGMLAFVQQLSNLPWYALFL